MSHTISCYSTEYRQAQGNLLVLDQICILCIFKIYVALLVNSHEISHVWLKQGKTKCTVKNILNTLNKHQIIGVYVSTNCHKCVEYAYIKKKWKNSKKSAGGINWKLLPDIKILGTST